MHVMLLWMCAVRAGEMLRIILYNTVTIVSRSPRLARVYHISPNYHIKVNSHKSITRAQQEAVVFYTREIAFYENVHGVRQVYIKRVNLDLRGRY